MRSKISPLILSGCICLLSSVALADNTPIVHGIPDGPISATRALGGSFDIALDAAPPASTQFYFDVPIGDPSASGILNVWPTAEDPGDGRGGKECSSPPAKGRQSYRLGMGTTKMGDVWYLRATVPPLQVGQTFCFAIAARLPLSPTEMTIIAKRVTAMIVHDVTLPPAPCDFTPEKLADYLAKTLGTSDGSGLVPACALADTADVAGKCTAYLTARDVHEADLTNLGKMSTDAPGYPNAFKAVAQEKADSDAKEKAFETAVPAIFTDAVRAAIVTSVANISSRGQAGKGATPSAANYASVDAGVFFSSPSGGAQTEIWLVPYLGLNLYSTPVDRTIDPSELTGTKLDRLRQRLSLTVGVTLSSPSIAGRTVAAPLLSRYPIVALGFRMTNYTRITAGAVLYDIADANPASAEHHLVAAPFVGAALDIDLIHLLTQAKL